MERRIESNISKCEMNSRGQRSGHCASHLLRERNAIDAAKPRTIEMRNVFTAFDAKSVR